MLSTLPPCSAFAKLDVWLEERNVLNELTQAPRTQMEGALTPEQKEVGGRWLVGLLFYMGSGGGMPRCVCATPCMTAAP